MVLPEFSLLQCTARSLSRNHGLRVNGREWEVAVGEAYLVSVLGQQLLDRGLHRMAVGTLVIRELNDRDRCLGISPHTGGIGSHFNSGSREQDHHIRVCTQALQIILARLPHLGLLVGVSQLSFYIGERLGDFAQPHIVPLELRVARIWNLGVHFLIEQFFCGKPFLFGSSLKHLLLNQVVQGFPLDFVFLIADWLKLPFDR